MGSEITLNGSVGLGGRNLPADVYNIQRALNDIPVDDGGPRPMLLEDGRCGGLTRGAIRNFQLKQFPGWPPDSRVDPGKKTLERLNALSLRRRRDWSRNQLVEVAGAFAPEALARVRLARQSLAAARRVYSDNSTDSRDLEAKRKADWHFKFHHAEDPLVAWDRVDSIYGRMEIVLQAHISGLQPLFETGFRRRDNEAVMYCTLGGWSAPDVPDTDGESDRRIKVVSEPFSPGTIVHELGHLCGGKEGSLDWIGHVANPIPLPNGAPLEDGPRVNYRLMSPEWAARNCASYQSLSERMNVLLGPPNGVEW